MREDQLAGEHPALDELLLTVEVGQNVVEDGDPLRDGRRKSLPFFPAHKERQRIELPWPIGPLWRPVNVVGDAALAQQAAGLLPPLVQAGRTEPFEPGAEPRPRFAQSAAAQPQLVVRIERREVACNQRAGYSRIRLGCR